jgi:hypothetical protein
MEINNELYRMDRTRRARRWRLACAEAKIVGGFAIVCGALFFMAAEVARIFLHFDDGPMVLPLCWFFLVLGYWLGRSGMRDELTRG